MLRVGCAGNAGAGTAGSTPAELVSRICAGDTTAEAELVTRYGRGVSLILRCAGARTAVDDPFRGVSAIVKSGMENARPGPPVRPSALWPETWRSTTPPQCAWPDPGNQRKKPPADSLNPLEQVLRSKTYGWSGRSWQNPVQQDRQGAPLTSQRIRSASAGSELDQPAIQSRDPPRPGTFLSCSKERPAAHREKARDIVPAMHLLCKERI